MYDWEHTYQRSLLAVTMAVAFALLGIAKLLHGDGILAVFAAGLVMNWIIRDEAGYQEARHERIQETTVQFFEVPVFIFFGMVMPFKDWVAMGWELWIYVLAILLLRRLPAILLLYPLRSVRDALFVGWFGPVAVAPVRSARPSSRALFQRKR